MLNILSLCVKESYEHLAYLELSRLLLCLATELLPDAGRGVFQRGDGAVALVKLGGQLRHLLPHSLHLAAVGLAGPLEVFSELQEETRQVASE